MTLTTEWSEQATSRTVDVNGVDVHFHDVGTGPPILFLHSYGPGTTSWLTFHKTVPAFADRYRCILMDLPNFGRTGPVVFEEQGHKAMARLAHGLLDALDISTTRVVANSLGGTVALVLAAAQPERVERLVVGGCSTGSDPYTLAPFPSEGIRAFFDAVSDPTHESFARYVRVHLDDESLVTDELVDQLLDNHTNHLDHFEALMSSPQIPHSCLADLPRIQAPTLVVHGRFDRMVNVEQALTIMSGLPDARLMVFGKCGHWPPYEKPAEYNSLVRQFLDAG